MTTTGNQFASDEYVLAYHGPLLYEARVLLAENWTDTNTLLGSTGPHYFIHYKGWKPTSDRSSRYYPFQPNEADSDSWDEWVPEDRLERLNERSVALSRRLLQAQTTKGRGGVLHVKGDEEAHGSSSGNGAYVNGSGSGSVSGAAEAEGSRAANGTAAGARRDSSSNGTASRGGQAEASENAAAGPSAAAAGGSGTTGRGRPARARVSEASTSKEGAAAGASGRNGNAAAGPSSAANGTGKGKENAAGGGPAAGNSASAAGPNTAAGRKRARDAALEAELAESARRPEVKIVIPDVLKLQLVDDWENVTKHNQLVTLPRTPNVRELLQDYRSYVEDTKADRSERSTSLLNEIISGITLYFDKALGNNLLYRFERAQYVEQTRRNDPVPQSQVNGAQRGEDGDASAPPPPRKRAMSEIYGAEHLLRLFVNFGPFISYTNIDSESLNILRECINDIMKWMIKEQKRLFIKEYETTSMQYQTLSRS